MIEDAVGILRHVEIWPAIAVVVTDGNTHTVGIRRHAGFLRHVRECAVAVVAIECVAERSSRFIEIARSAVHQVDIHPAIIVVVQERASGAYSFRQIHFRRLTAYVNPGDTAGGGRNFFKRGNGILSYCGGRYGFCAPERGAHPRPPKNLKHAPPRNHVTPSHLPAWFAYAVKRRTPLAGPRLDSSRRFAVEWPSRARRHLCDPSVHTLWKAGSGRRHPL